MERRTHIAKVQNGIVYLRDDSKWRIAKYDAGSVLWWSPEDILGYQITGFTTSPGSKRSALNRYNFPGIEMK